MFQYTHPIPPKWLRNAHAQTIYAKTRQSPTPHYRRELWTDSHQTDLVAYDFVDSPYANAPVVVLFHGLEGSSHSHYSVELMRCVQERGWHGVVAHFRGCGGVRAIRAYHSGDTQEIAHMLGCLKTRYPTQKIYAMGVSLGGNALAKYLGEQGNLAIVDAAAVVSAPVNLNAAADALSAGMAKWLYTPYCLHTLKHKVPYHHTVKTLSEFDDVYTAPMHGFSGCRDYYPRCEALPYLPKITRPTLLLNAQNDPFLPAEFLPNPQQVSRSVMLLQPEHGGHCGFVNGEGRGNIRWLPETVLSFFEYAESEKSSF